MKRKLTFSETLSVSSMLFGLFFGAGNLIFPAYMGQASGRNLPQALIGFLITGTGLPLLAVISLGVTHSDGVFSLSRQVGRRWGYFFSCALYLTIGPFFAIPRCFTVPFEVGIAPLLPENVSPRLALLIFSMAFFVLMLGFSLHPGKILVWVGKLLNPLFLSLFVWIISAALLHPMGTVMSVEPTADYMSAPLVQGMLEGYNTMDALAGLAFGIVIVNVINSLGVTEAGDVAVCTVKAGTFACVLMGIIYAMTAIVGAQSRGVFPAFANGGTALSAIVRLYFPGIGSILFALVIFFACLKTAIGLITSCGEAFAQMFPDKLDYRRCAIVFSLGSFAIANIGLTAIIQFSLPVLMMLYPLAVTLIMFALTEHKIKIDTFTRRVVMGVTLVCACGDFIAALPEGVRTFTHLDMVQRLYSRVLPFYSMGLGWVTPTVITFIVMLLYTTSRKLSNN